MQVAKARLYCPRALAYRLASCRSQSRRAWLACAFCPAAFMPPSSPPVAVPIFAPLPAFPPPTAPPTAPTPAPTIAPPAAPPATLRCPPDGGGVDGLGGAIGSKPDWPFAQP